MGFFDRLAGKKRAATAATPAVAVEKPPEEPSAAAGGVMPKLVAAREKLEAGDLPAALTIYEEVLAVAGDRADVLVTVSGDLGVTGHVKEIIELVAPRYAADRHGPAIGSNVLQAYLAVNDPEAAQHVLDILFSLERPEIEERLHGFSNAIADLLAQDLTPLPGATGLPPGDVATEPPKVDMISISKPIWFYGLEPLAARILPEKQGKPRRVAFAQLAVLALPDPDEQMKQPEEEMGRLSRALPLWLAETFCFSAHYTPVAAVGVFGRQHYAIFGFEWKAEHVRQLADTTGGGLDYVFTGAVRRVEENYELMLRLWEVRKFRERKQFTARWTAATADAELAKLHEQVRTFMEWSPAEGGLAYSPPVQPRSWLDVLAGSLSLFLAEKKLLAPEMLAPPDEMLAPAAAGAAAGESASLAFLSARNRAERLNLAARLEAVLASSPLIAQATGLPARPENQS